MNRRLKIFMSVLLIACGITACWDSSRNSTSIQAEKEDENRTVVLEAQAEEDRIVSLHQTVRVDMSEYDEAGRQEIHERISEVETLCSDMSGVEYSFSESNGVMREEITVDLKEADLQELVDNDVIDLAGDEIPDFISLEETVEKLENAGWNVAQ